MGLKLSALWGGAFPRGEERMTDADGGPQINADLIPIGMIVPWLAGIQPTMTPEKRDELRKRIQKKGYLFCHGQAVSRTGFAGLFAVIGTFCGPGDGSTTFNLPDTRGYCAGEFLIRTHKEDRR